MAITFDWFTETLRNQNIRFMVQPDYPAVMFGVTTQAGKQFMVRVTVDSNGYFLQIHSVQLAICPKGSPHTPAVLAVLSALNLKYRVIKYALDTNDGEVMVYADLTLADSQPTRDQVMSLISYFIDMLDRTRDRVHT